MRRESDLPVYLAVVLGYLLLLPGQLNPFVAGSIIPPYRIFLLAASLYVLGAAVKGRARFAWPDLCILGAVAWICLAMSITSDFEVAVTAGIAHIADIGLAYFFARVVFIDLRAFRIFLLLSLPGLLGAGIIMMIESISFTHLIQPLFDKLTGQSTEYFTEERLGLMRARGPFVHPILAGLYLASFLSLYWAVGFRGWVRIAGIVAALCSFFSVSSAALICLTSSMGLLVYNWLTQHFVNLSWRLFFAVSALFVFVIELGSNRGTFNLVMQVASLNSQTGSYRVLIWRYGSENVEKNPWFGLGYADWERPQWMTDSVDNYWLLTAMRFGLLPSVLIALALFLALIAIIRKSITSSASDQQAERGVAIALAVFTLGLTSVAVWLTVQVWFFVLLGATVSLAAAPSAHRFPRRAPVLEVQPRLPISA